MNRRRARVGSLLVVVVLSLMTSVVAQEVESGRREAPNRAVVDLLDRGENPAQPDAGPGAAATHTGLMTATLANLAGTPGVTIGAIMTVAPPAPVGVFHGYFFAPGIDFPTSYHPFFVTGACLGWPSHSRQSYRWRGRGARSLYQCWRYLGSLYNSATAFRTVLARHDLRC